MRDFKEITSKENSLIKLTSELQNSSKKRQENGLFVLEGLRICKDAYDNGIRFDKLIVSKNAMEKYHSEISEFSDVSAECFILPDSLFKRISETDSPQGIIVLASKPTMVGLDYKNGKFVGLENMQDPSNLGAIARSCEALGVNGILLSKNCCDPYSPKSLRASMGTLLRVPVVILDDFANDIKNSGLKSFACVVDCNALPITEAKFCKGSIVLIGNEANGLTDDTVNSSDYKITIPMNGTAESLNASVAAAIAAWEMMK